jgi:hypothetical protein
VSCVSSQLMYDRSDGGRLFRTYVSCNLGWWHTYKFVAFKLWQMFAPNLIAPLWHHLYPNSQFHIKPSSFSSVLYHFLALHWSYPSFKDQLNSLLEIPADQTSRRYTNTVKDLIFLFEFAIPTVCHIDVMCGVYPAILTIIFFVDRSLTTES